MTAREPYVRTKEILAAVEGHEIEILRVLGIAWPPQRGEKHIQCPYPEHSDRHPSWRWDTKELRAFCTCGSHSILDIVAKVKRIDFEAAKLAVAEIIARTDLIRRLAKKSAPRKGGGDGDTLSESDATVQHRPGCTLVAYAEAKRLPIDFLLSLGLRQIAYQGTPAISMPYFGVAADIEPIVRFRLALDGPQKFCWRKGSKARLYGVHRLPEARKAGFVVLVEGESDSHTLWFHDFPALGLPGAQSWNEECDAPLLAEFREIFIVVEPDSGGEGILRWLARSAIAPRARLVRLDPLKDPSALYLANPDHFREAFQQALDQAEPYRQLREREQEVEAAQAKEAAGDLISCRDILGRFGEEVEKAGLVGETHNAKILFLAHTSRLFDRPISVAVKGVSSGGKSFTEQIVIRFLPPDAYWERTALSDRALAYSDENFSHRHLVLYEATAMQSDIMNYLMRSLLSEGCIKYEVIEKTRDGLRPRVIEKLGPTGLILTTTAGRLHPENETRLLSLSVKDTSDQTKAVMRQLARTDAGDSLDYRPWHAFQRWLALGETRVVVPFAPALAELMPPVAVRLRRDFQLLLTLIRTHAMLHRETRSRDSEGRIVAIIDDYSAIRVLIGDQFSETIEATIPKTVRETVDAVKALTVDRDRQEAPVGEIAKALGLDKSAASRRIKVAVERGYLVNNETGKGRPARVAVGDAMPDELNLLPTPERLLEALQCCGNGSEDVQRPASGKPNGGNGNSEALHGCTNNRGDASPPPIPDAERDVPPGREISL